MKFEFFKLYLNFKIKFSQNSPQEPRKIIYSTHSSLPFAFSWVVRILIQREEINKTTIADGILQKPFSFTTMCVLQLNQHTKRASRVKLITRRGHVQTS
jgi:hypothetical protein